MNHKLVKSGYDNSKTESEIVRSIGYQPVIKYKRPLKDIMLVGEFQPCKQDIFDATYEQI